MKYGAHVAGMVTIKIINNALVVPMGTGSFPGVRRPGRSHDHPPPSSTEVKERVDLYLYSPLGLRGLF
jgi:hypothetical protein